VHGDPLDIERPTQHVWSTEESYSPASLPTPSALSFRLEPRSSYLARETRNEVPVRPLPHFELCLRSRAVPRV